MGGWAEPSAGEDSGRRRYENLLHMKAPRGEEGLKYFWMGYKEERERG